MARRNRNRAEWSRLVAELSRSGLSRQEFAEQHGLNVRSLENWIHRFRREELAPTMSRSAMAAGFVPVRVRRDEGQATKDAAPAVIEVRLGANVGLRFAPGVDCEYLGRLVAAMVRAC